jgi:hypothetical protein
MASIKQLPHEGRAGTLTDVSLPDSVIGNGGKELQFYTSLQASWMDA